MYESLAEFKTNGYYNGDIKSENYLLRNDYTIAVGDVGTCLVLNIEEPTETYKITALTKEYSDMRLLQSSQ